MPSASVDQPTWTMCSTVAGLDDALMPPSTLSGFVQVLRQWLPRIIPTDRIAIGRLVEDSQVEIIVLTGDEADEPPLRRPAAGSALQRAQDLGVVHIRDLAASGVPTDRELAEAGYAERLIVPITLGDAVIAVLNLAHREAIDEPIRDLAKVVAGLLSARSHRLGPPRRRDDHPLEFHIEQLRQATETMERTDPLTQLPNRVAVFEAIDRARSQADDGQPRSFAFLDIDHFKVINERLGHSSGDTVLVAIADRLRSLTAGAQVSFGRVGGDEFGVILAGDAKELKDVLDALAAGLTTQPIEIAGSEVPLTFTGGVVLIEGRSSGRVAGGRVGGGRVAGDADVPSIEQIVAHAEAAAYQAKRDGRGRVAIYRHGDPGHRATRIEMRQIDVMRSAIANGRLTMVAQPIRSTAAGVAPPMDVEVLVRLYDETNHTLLPDDFVVLAEQYDLVNALDRAVLAQVVRTMSSGAPHGRVSCNVSPHSLLDPSFVDWAADLLSVTRQGPRVVLELTERLPIGRVGAVRDGMEVITHTGAQFALDDFGAGTTSFGNLRELPLSVLKIDGALTRGALTSPVDRAMVRSTVEVADALGLRTIAEGVETSEQLSAVTALGVGAIQGYFFGQPRPWPGG